MNPLVSIVTPCYNGEDYLAGYFESIISQTYRPLELIFVNDGSTDCTEEIAKSYQKRLVENGIDYTYIYQKNAGQAHAINAALPRVSGEFLVWPDSDDLMTADAIEKKMSFLCDHPEYSFVRSNGRKFDYSTGEDLGRISWYGDQLQEDIFLDLIEEKTYCTPGCYMVKMDALRDIYPNLKIFESSEGQNWQILIPMAGKHKCGYIDEDLFLYAVRSNSHSHVEKNLEQSVTRYLKLKEILEDAISHSGRSDRNYQYIVDTKYEKLLLGVYSSYRERGKATECYNVLKQNNELDGYYNDLFLKTFRPLGYRIYRIKNKSKRAVKKLMRIVCGK